ncbi:MAG: Cation-independent mannose-6-phosphate receptor CI-MPR [Watsoniomyces obsoletus]|nr:MAG: Cation-independent mannose-6-phosphate receptor CI-MPR [Watsoniomyces obsoletus]
MPFFQGTKQRQPPSEDSSYSDRVRRLFTGTSSVQRVSSITKNNNRPRLGLGVLDGSPQIHDSPALQNSTSPAPTLFPSTGPIHPQLPSHALAHPLSRYLSEQVLQYNARDTARTISVYDDSQVPGDGVDPGEQQLGELVHLRRQQRRRHQRGQQKGGRRSIFSRLNEQTVKSKLISCLLSGLILLIVLSIYLSLALSTTKNRRPTGQEIHVVFILIILVITIMFCHSLVRLCMIVLLTTPPARKPKRNHLGTAAARQSSGRDLHDIDLERNQEGVGMTTQNVDVDVDSVHLEAPPPAYGLWRAN